MIPSSKMKQRGNCKYSHYDGRKVHPKSLNSFGACYSNFTFLYRFDSKRQKKIRIIYQIVFFDLPPINDTFYVEHGYNLEHIFSAQGRRGTRVSQQAPQCTIHDPRSVTLSGMDAGRQKYYFTILKMKGEFKCRFSQGT